MSTWVKSFFRELTTPNLLIIITAVQCDGISRGPACALFGWEDCIMLVPASWSQGLFKSVNSFMLLSLVRKAWKRPNRPPASWCGPSLRLSPLEFQNFVCVCVWPHHTAFRILVPQPGIEPGPLPVKVWSLNHWTTREFLCSKTLSLDPSFQQHAICDSKWHQE